MLDEKETIEYIRRAKGGDQTAKQALIDGNVSLIKCIVKRYLGKGVAFPICIICTTVWDG